MELKEIAKKMKDIDFCMMATQGQDGGFAGRPMSNNQDVEYSGDSFFFALDSTNTVQDLQKNKNVGLSFSGAKGLLGKPPIFIQVAGEGQLIKDKAQFEKHWNKDLEYWFKDGLNTPGLVLIKVHASRIHYWDGQENGEVKVS